MNSALENTTLSDIYHFDLETYHRLSYSGYLPRNLELLEGLIIQKMTISPLHAKIVNKLRRLIERNLPTGIILRQESPLSISELNSEPEPDGEYLDKKNYYKQDNVDLPVVGGQIRLSDLL